MGFTVTNTLLPNVNKIEFIGGNLNALATLFMYQLDL